MKYFTYLFLILPFSFNFIFAQNDDARLISLLLNNDKLNNKIESLKLSVIYIDNDRLITTANSEQLNEIKKFAIKYSELDKIKSSDKFYVVSSKKNQDISSNFGGDKIIYKGNNFVIVKNAALDSEYASLLGLKLVELKGVNKFCNVKHIWKKDKANLSDSLINSITSLVSIDSVQFYIQSLQNFQTRFLMADTRDTIAQWIKNQFIQMGLSDVIVDSFQYQGTWQKNVIATLQGIYEPQIYNIVGGHHDSYSSGDPMVFAPGADDNASGTAAVLEIARVIKASNYQPESTIKFITFAAEEYGLWGSEDYAEKALNSGLNIKIMINHDMISHTSYPVNQSEVDINRYSGYDYLRDLAFYCIENYSTLSPSNGSLNSAGSDSYSFWERGFPSVYFEENNFSPFYHSPADTIGNYSMEYCAEVIKASCATLLLNIVMPTMIENYKIVDAGTGNSLLLSYNSNNSPDFYSYKIYVGTQSGAYDYALTTTDTSFTLGGLSEGILYYVGVSVVDQAGYESLITERSALPFLVPSAPEDFSITPLWHEIQLTWSQNLEFDILGYNIYRSEIEGEPGNKLNLSVYFDTTYIDNNATNGIYYYYSLTAVDSQYNESENSIAERSKVISLDQGILIVDETVDGDGSIMNPTDEQVDDFYNDILINFRKDKYDLIDEGNISINDLGAYSTVIWHGNDYQDLSAPFNFKQSIEEYLNYGGNFIYNGYRPAKAFENSSGYTVGFSSGDFVYDYLKIDSAFYRTASLFIGALTELSGYNSIFVDSSKSLLSDSYHLRFIEAILPNSEAEKIYSFNSNYDSTSSQGILKGKPVGIEYIGSDFKTITLSFPLYYMKKDLAKTMIEYILTNKFDEILQVDKYTNEIPDSYRLEQNYPNPFNPSTKIVYSIPNDELVKITIYNILGEEVKMIRSNFQKAGTYEINFNASNLSSGMYLYRLEAGHFSITKKMIILK